MGKSLLACAWAFILAVAAYDTYFAWQNWAFFDTWELNPLARWVAVHGGFAALCGAKAAVVAFAALVAVVCYRQRRRLTAFLYTTVVGGLHLGLSLVYVVGRLHGY